MDEELLSELSGILGVDFNDDDPQPEQPQDDDSFLQEIDSILSAEDVVSTEPKDNELVGEVEAILEGKQVPQIEEQNIEVPSYMDQFSKPEFESEVSGTSSVDTGAPLQELPKEEPLSEYAPARALGAETGTPLYEPLTKQGIPTRGARESTPMGGLITGIEKSIPFVGLEGSDIEQIEQEHKGSVIAGEIAGNVGQALAGGVGIGKVLAKTAVAKSPLLMTTLSRVLPAIGLRGAQTAEQVVEGKADIKDALFNTLVESGGGAAFSILPELAFPPGVAQAIAQPLADVMYQAAVDATRQGGSSEGIFTKEWFKQQIPTIAMSLGFGVKDALDPTFAKTQKSIYKEVGQKIGVTPKDVPAPKVEATTKDVPTKTDVGANTPEIKRVAGSDTPVEAVAKPEEQAQPKPKDMPVEKVDGPVPSVDDLLKERGIDPKNAMPQKPPKIIPEPKVKTASEEYVKKEFEKLRAKDPRRKRFKPDPTEEKQLYNDFKQKFVGDYNTKFPDKNIEYKKAYTPEEIQTMYKLAKKGELGDDADAALKQFKREPGFLNQSGAVGQRQQIKPKFESKDANEMQKIFESQRAQVKKKFGFSTDRFADKVLSRVVDVGAPWKRRLAKNKGSEKVIMHHDLSRGAAGEAARQYEIKEKEIYKNIPHENEHLFADFIQAKRSVEVIDKKGQEFKTPGGEKNKIWLDEIEKNSPDLYKSLEKSRQKYFDAISKEPLNDYVKEGIMTKEEADGLLSQNAHYSPRRFLQHIDPDGKGFDSGGNVISVPDSGLKKLDSGSEEAMINNPRLLLAQIQMRTSQRIFKNRANKALYEFIKTNPDNKLGGVVEEGTNKIPGGMTRISAMIEGKRKNVLIPTDVAKHWVGQDPKINQNLAKFINVVSGSAILKPMATGLNPGFALANLPRDIMHSWFTTKEYSPVLPIAWAQQGVDMLSVAKDVFGRKGRVIEYSKEGGSMDLLTQQGQLQKKPWETRTPVSESINQIQKFLGWAGESSELLTRMALRERAIKNGKSKEEATWVARNYLDFAQGGSWVKAANNAVPYLNAGIQGTRGVLSTSIKSPALAAFKASQIIGVGMALAYWNRRSNEEGWDSVSSREKTSKFIITTPFTRLDEDGNNRHIYFTIPKDQGQRIFATIGEEMSEMMQTGEVDFEKIKHSIKDFIPVNVGVSIPTFSALWGYIYNKDFWSNEDIWKGSKKVSPKEEMWNTTPKVWQMFGEKTGLSPERSRRAFNKVVPMNAYTYLTEAFANQMFGMVTGEEKKEITKPFLAKLSKVPISQRLVRETYPVTRATKEYLEKADKLNIDTTKSNGKQLTFEQLRRKVDNAERRFEDVKARNNRNFDFLSTAAIIGNQDTKGNFLKELKALKSENITEYRRVKRRLKWKHKKEYYKLISGK